MTIVKGLVAVVVFSLLGISIYFAFGNFRNRSTPLEQEKQLQRALEEAEQSDIMPGDQSFQKASELLTTGDYPKAREKLLFLVNFYPTSELTQEARRILGELNLDQLLSPEELDGKTSYQVQRGDSYLKIAKDHQTTIDYLIATNNLMRVDRIHPGTSLLVQPLNFKIHIDLNQKTLSLWNGKRFLIAYFIQDTNLPSSLKGSYQTDIKSKFGVYKGQTYAPSHPKYSYSSKVLGLRKPNIQIRTLARSDEEDPGLGFFLNQADMEELVILLRLGNQVEIKISS